MNDMEDEYNAFLDKESSDEMEEYNVKFKAITDLAILVEYEKKSIWFPKSQIKSAGKIDYEMALQGMSISIMIPDWLAIDKEMI